MTDTPTELPTDTHKDVLNAETFAIPKVVAATNVAPPVESPELQALNAMLESWYVALKGMVPRGKLLPADQIRAGAASLALTNLVCRVGSTELFDRLKSFYADHKNDICQKTIALAGNKNMDFANARKVSFLYRVFSAIGTHQPITISGTAFVEVTKCQALIPYLKANGVRVV